MTVCMSFQVDNAPPTPKKPKRQLVEEDPCQPVCALSGESFEHVYDSDADKWFFGDAVMLHGKDAAKYGLRDGTLVKA